MMPDREPDILVTVVGFIAGIPLIVIAEALKAVWPLLSGLIGVTGLACVAAGLLAMIWGEFFGGGTDL